MTTGKKYGPGTHFTLNSSNSAEPECSPPDADRHQRVIYCKVAVGEYAEGNQVMQTQPAKENGDLYDSTVDNTENPTIFVIYNDTQAYPDYVVTFQVSTLTMYN